jgi:anti-sigma regulatory factor (Ser/Thr protein kinase)
MNRKVHVRSRTDAFCHEAAMYSGADGFLHATLPFISEALHAREPILVAVGQPKIRRLRSALGADADQVRFVDMDLIGANPARIIPAWLRFVAERPDADRRVWGVGEPIGPDCNGELLFEAQLHESLLNVAFARTPRFHLLCPYDAEALNPAIIEEAHRSHPVIRSDDGRRESPVCRDLATLAAPCARPLARAPLRSREVPFYGPRGLLWIRRFVLRRASAAGLGSARANDLVLAVNELLANSLVHGGGRGVLRIWEDPHSLICEVADRGHIDEPLVGRFPPARDEGGGWGLWLANQVCDLVQIRSNGKGTLVRVHMRR